MNESKIAISKMRSPKDSSVGIKVIVRLRPLIERQSTNTNNSDCFVQMSGNVTSLLPKNYHSNSESPLNSAEVKHFTVDEALWSFDSPHENYASQKDVYDHCGREFLNHTLEGYNTCLFAYGQTGSGKSYTMFGKDNDGLIPRITEELFARIRLLDQDNTAVSVSINYFEIYNEEVFDLLDSTTTMKKRMRENLKGPFVEGLNEIEVKSTKEIFKYLREGTLKRKTASTRSNLNSSRSHAVFTMKIVQKKYLLSQVVKEKNSHIRLVDLAGSERANNTGNTGIRLKEGSNINKSLTTLGRVLTILSENSGNTGTNKQVVPYRDSALTWLLKESIGGNSKSCMICCISPTDYEETLSSLRYATLTKKIQNKAVVNDISKKSQGFEELEKLQIEEKLKLNQIIDDLKQQVDEKENRELVKIRNLIKFNNDLQNEKFYKLKSELSEKNQIINHLQNQFHQSLTAQNNVTSQHLETLYNQDWESFNKQLSDINEEIQKQKNDFKNITV